MRLKLYCNRYAHFKDALVCSVSCAYRARCHDFALFYDAHRADVDSAVAEYYEARRDTKEEKQERQTFAASPVIAQLARPVEMRTLIRLEVKREMAESLYIWIDKEDRAELLETVEVLRRAERGQKAKSIYRVAQEMELRYQLVPRKSIDRAKRAAAVQEERVAARRRARAEQKNGPPAPVPFPAPVVARDESSETSAAPSKRTRTRSRVAKIASGR